MNITACFYIKVILSVIEIITIKINFMVLTTGFIV